MPWLESLSVSFPYPLFTAAAAAALLVVVVFVMQRNSLGGMVSFLGRALVVTVGVVLVWVLLDRAAIHERQADRRSLDERAVSLTAQAIAPGSALACLDAMAGDAIETACEQNVFASPASVAAAISYTAARLSLLADATAYAERADADYDAVLAPLRLALESDRLGLVAHVFAIRDSCTQLQCDALALLRNPARVQANLRDRTFESHVGRHAAGWPARAGGPVASAAPDHATATPVSPQYDFPSAASIPAVSIMSAEPAAAAPPKPAPAPAAQTRRPPPPSARAAAPRPPPATSAPALQISPPLATSEPAAQSLR